MNHNCSGSCIADASQTCRQEIGHCAFDVGVDEEIRWELNRYLVCCVNGYHVFNVECVSCGLKNTCICCRDRIYSDDTLSHLKNRQQITIPRKDHCVICIVERKVKGGCRLGIGGIRELQ